VDPEDRFTALYRAHYGAVLRYACRRIGPEPARDVAAETFLIAWRRIAAVPADPAEALPWLYGVARLVLANSDRSRRRFEHLTVRLLRDGDAGTAQAPDLADAVAERARLRQALESLPQADQEALRLVGWEELDLAGAAAAMGCSRSAMAVRLHRARRRMLRALSAIEHGADPRGAAEPGRPRPAVFARTEAEQEFR
jgi:RNA polymerase sigma factor (sigma-70 family)